MNTRALEVKQLYKQICGGGSCPTAFETNRETFIIQGYGLNAGDKSLMTAAEGEDFIEVPRQFVLDLAKRILEG